MTCTDKPITYMEWILERSHFHPDMEPTRQSDLFKWYANLSTLIIADEPNEVGVCIAEPWKRFEIQVESFESHDLTEWIISSDEICLPINRERKPDGSRSSHLTIPPNIMYPVPAGLWHHPAFYIKDTDKSVLIMVIRSTKIDTKQHPLPEPITILT